LNKRIQLVRLQQQLKAQMKAEQQQQACRLSLAAKLVQTKSDRRSRDFP
jgi:hypothetical protein